MHALQCISMVFFVTAFSWLFHGVCHGVCHGVFHGVVHGVVHGVFHGVSGGITWGDGGVQLVIVVRACAALCALRVYMLI